MNIIISGPQGSGKGTQAELLAKKYGLVHFEMGKILRSIADSNNPVGPQIKKYLVSGNLVPDEFVRLVAWDFISKHSNRDVGFIFEGYPRSVAQYEHLQDMLLKFGKKIDLVVLLDIPEAESIKRVSSRRTCSKCGQVYNVISDRPKQENVCDVCGGTLILREDDKPEAIKRRLELYRSQTAPVFVRAKQDGIAFEIKGEQGIDQIHKQIVDRLGM